MALLLSKALFGDESSEAAGARDFLTADQIQSSIRTSKNYKHDGTEPSRATSLLFFDTRMQRTWLTKTALRLYCILDDVRKAEPHINWSVSMEEVVGDGKVLWEIRSHHVSDTGKSGLIDFGPKHKDWLYSTRLFTVRPVEKEIEAFLLS